MRWQAAVALSMVALGLSLAGCGAFHLHAASTSSTSPTNASATGFWSGTDSATGLTLQALINSVGQADFIRGDGVQYIGTVEVSGDTLAVSVDGYSSFGATFPGGSTGGTGSVNGTVDSGASIRATLRFTPTGATQETSTWILAFQSLSNMISSLSAVAGTYTSGTAFVGGVDPMSGASVTISSNGMIYGQGSGSGCVLNGAVTVGDSSYDIYEVVYMLSSCTGRYAALNGVQFTGLAVFNTKTAPNQFVMGVTGQAASDGHRYGLVTTLTVN